MGWYINRGQAPEGPFEEQQVVQMIRSGQLRGGTACPPGGFWGPLESHPPFAEALGQAALATAPTMIGEAQPGYPPAAAAPPGLPPVAPKKSRAGLVIGLVVALLSIGGGAAAYFFLFAKPGAKLAASVPADATIYLEVPSIPAALEAYFKSDLVKASKVEPKKVDEQVREAGKDAFGAKADTISDVVASLESIAFAMGDPSKGSEAAALIAFGKTGPIEELLKSERFSAKGELAGGKRYELKKGASPSGADLGTQTGALKLALAEMHVDGERDALVWFAKKKLLVVGSAAYIERIGGVVNDGKDALAASEPWKKVEFEKGALAMGYIDVGKLTEPGKSIGDKKFFDGYLKDVSPIAVTLMNSDAGVVLAIAGELKGDKISADDALPPPAKLKLPAKLPKETFEYLALSTKTDKHGKELKDRLVKQLSALEEKSGQEFDKGVDEVAQQLGMTADELFNVPGDELAIGLVAAKDIEIDVKKEPTSYIAQLALAVLIDVHDKDAAKKLLHAVRDKAKAFADVTEQGDGFDATPKAPGAPKIAVRMFGGTIAIAAGGLADRVLESAEKGKDALDGDKAERVAVSSTGGNPRVLLWFDLARAADRVLAWLKTQPEFNAKLAEAEKQAGVAFSELPLTGDNRFTATLALDLDSKGASWRYRLAGVNAPFTLGVFGALGVYGVRRYLASSKTSEAKQGVGAIARAAVFAYERETDDASAPHALCKSAIPVPATVPHGKKYQPRTSIGEDFDSADATTGWKCLRFSLTQPHYYQYGYSVGGPYKGPARGGPDPGPNGFEASAEGDLDADGVTSLFTVTGTIKNGELHKSQLFISNEME